MTLYLDPASLGLGVVLGIVATLAALACVAITLSFRRRTF